jgi:putative inorganic carbon (HCO3(-)) transporter
VDTRTTIWRVAIDMIQDRPVTGVGLDQFLGQYGRRYVRPEGWPERYTSHPHNLVLDFWLSLGIGGLAVLWLLIELVGRRLKAALEGPALSVQRASVAMLAAGLAHGVIDNSFFLPYLATFTWLGLGLSSPTQGARNG